MGSRHIYKSNFYSDIFEDNAIPYVYKKLRLKAADEAFYSPETKAVPKSKIYSFHLVPDYLELQVDNGLICKSIFQKYGYAMNLAGYASVGQYLKSEFKTSVRKNFNRTKNKLENCYNINYKVFYGSIDNGQYNKLMHTLHGMLAKRFEERQDKNPVLENWTHYLDSSQNLINSCKASLLVIFSDDDPIAITLNYHHKKIIYSAIASYNIDYYKYSLGNLMIYKLTEWAILNHYKLIDLGYGNFSHKQVWHNKVYDFKHHVILSEKQTFGNVYAVFLKFKYQLINYLLSKKVNVFFNKIKRFFKSDTNEVLIETVNVNVNKINHLQDKDLRGLTPVSLKSTDYPFLKKPVNDFVYYNNNHIDNVSIFKANNTNDVFYIKGNKNSIKLTCKKL